jgi:hypothetical protein
MVDTQLINKSVMTARRGACMCRQSVTDCLRLGKNPSIRIFKKGFCDWVIGEKPMPEDTIKELRDGITLIVGGLGSFLLGSLQADITYGISEFVLGALNGSGSIKGSLGAVKTAGTVIGGLFALLGIVFTVGGAYLVVKAVREMASTER